MAKMKWYFFVKKQSENFVVNSGTYIPLLGHNSSGEPVWSTNPVIFQNLVSHSLVLFCWFYPSEIWTCMTCIVWKLVWPLSSSHRGNAVGGEKR